MDVGGVKVGGTHPIVVQSMTNTDTADVTGTVNQIMALAKAGSSLREVCEAVGIPPVLHMGSCVDNSRILMAATNLVAEGGLGDDIADLPVAGAAPELMIR